MSVVGILLWPWRMELAGLLAPDPTVQFETAKYLTFNILAVPFTVASVVLAGSLNGAGATVYPMLSFSIATWCVRLPVAWLLGHIVWQDASGRLRRPAHIPNRHVHKSALGGTALRLGALRHVGQTFPSLMSSRNQGICHAEYRIQPN